MPTPEEWLGNFQVNLGAAATGTQFDPHIIGLSNGNILVAWVESSNGAIGGALAGSEIVGQLLGIGGAPIGGPFVLNSLSTADDETDFDIAATNDGGFVLVYIDDSIGNPDQRSVLWQRHNAAGASVASATVADETVVADFLANPKVAVDLNSNLSFVTFSDNIGAANDDISFRTVAADGTLSAKFGAAGNTADVDTDADVAVLANGNIVSVYEELDAGVVGIEFAIRTSAGANVVLGQEADVDANQSAPKVASLAGGGFVLVWQESSDIFYRVYDNVGTALTTVSAAATGADLQLAPDVVALNGGGFVIAWDNNNTGVVEARRFDAAGAPDGTLFVINAISAVSTNLSLTADGRILSTAGVNGGEIFASIWDSRGSIINALSYNSPSANFLASSTVTAGPGDTLLDGNGIAGAVLLGGAGNDLIFGGPNSQTLRGGDGNDTIEGEAGADSMDGGAGLDVLSYANSDAAVDILINLVTGEGGHAAGDTMTGFEGLIGSNFDDSLIGQGFGTNVTLEGGNGNDRITGLNGTQTLSGGSGNDTIFGDDSTPTSTFGDRLDGGSGKDSLLGAAGADAIFGGTQNDTIDGGNGGDTINGNAGIDLLTYATSAAAVNVQLNGAANSGGSADGDVLAGFEHVLGTAFDDTIDANGFDATLDGGDGDDSLVGGLQSQLLNGGIGEDTLSGSPLFSSGSNDTLDGGDGADVLTGADAGDLLIGGSGQDLLFGMLGGDALQGGVSSDTLNGGGAGDTLDGGSGIDWADYTGATARIVADLQIPASQVSDALGDIYISIENLRGSNRKDALRGDGQANVIEGAGNRDNLNGRAGNDTLIGGKGQDTLNGSAGQDRFLLDSIADGGPDTILDFSNAADEVALDGSAFGLSPGALSAGRFVVGNQALDASDRLIYNAGIGELYFDADGNGVGAQILIATFSNLVALSAADFVVI